MSVPAPKRLYQRIATLTTPTERAQALVEVDEDLAAELVAEHAATDLAEKARIRKHRAVLRSTKVRLRGPVAVAAPEIPLLAVEHLRVLPPQGQDCRCPRPGCGRKLHRGVDGPECFCGYVWPDWWDDREGEKE